MAVILPLARVAPRQLSSRSSQLLTRLHGTTPLLRVTYSNSDDSAASKWFCKSAVRRDQSALCRSYATASGKPTTTKKPSTSRTKSAKSTTSTRTKAKKPAAKKRPVKPKKKKVKVKKAKAKAKPKRELSEAGKKKLAAKLRNQTLKELKEKAMLTEPKNLPATAYQVLLMERLPGKADSVAGIQERFKEISIDYRGITPAERERLNHIANQNRAANEKAYKEWLVSFSPKQIKDANSARLKLRKLKKNTTKGPRTIKDDRLVKLPVRSYTFFFEDRHRTGDFKSVPLPDAAKLIAKEWKELDDSTRQSYIDQAAKDRSRYFEEYERVYGEPPETLKKAAKPAV